jgi:hypothetical protein
MNVQKLNKSIDVLREDVGDALIATDIWTVADGQIIAGWNKQPQAAAIFNDLTNHMIKTLEVAKFPVLGRYYLLDLVDKNMVVIIPLGDYQWGILLNSEKAPLGLLLNVIIPKSIDAFEEAIAA